MTRRIPRVTKRKREERERGGLDEREGITRKEYVQSQSQREERWREQEVGEEMEESISNFSADFTVDSFPIRLG